MNKNIRGLMPTGFYHAKVVVSHKNDNDELEIVWNIDSGEYAYRTLIETYPVTEFGLGKLWNMSLNLNYVPYNENDEDFYSQYYGMRAKLHVTVDLDGRYKKNIILEHALPEIPPDYDVTKEKKDDHFYHTKNKPDLPL